MSKVNLPAGMLVAAGNEGDHRYAVLPAATLYEPLLPDGIRAVFVPGVVLPGPDAVS